MDVAHAALPHRSTTDTHRLALWVGLVGGLLLPLAAAVCYSTYSMTAAPFWRENTRQFGIVYLAGEILAILHARRRGFDPTMVWGLLPRWAKGALTLFLSTFAIGSVRVSADPAFSIMLSVGWLVQLMFAAALWHLFCRRAGQEPAAIWHGFALGLVALTVVTAFHFLMPPAAIARRAHGIEWSYAVPGFISARLFGAWAGAVMALLLGVAWSRAPQKRGRDLLYAGTALAFGLSVWTATRAALVGVMVTIPVAWMIAGRPRDRAVWTILPCWLIVGAVIALLLQKPYGDMGFSFLRGTGTADGFSSGRLGFWCNALRMAAHHPLFGSGAGSTGWLVPFAPGYYHIQPHNAVVQFLLDWGIVPAVAALTLLAGATWHAHRAARLAPEVLPFVLMLDCLLTISMFDGMLHFAQFIMLVMGCLAICLSRLPAR